MTQPKTPKQTRRFRPFASIGSKITMIVLVMGTASALAGVLVSMVFGRVSEDMGVLTTERLPAMALSSQLVAASSDVKDAMTRVLLVNDLGAMEKAEAKTKVALEQLQLLIAELPEDTRLGMEKQFLTAEAALSALITARNSSFRNSQWIQAQTAEMRERSAEMQKILIVMAQEASTSLAAGGQETIELVETALPKLVDDKIFPLRNLLEARSEINLLAGTALAFSDTLDSAPSFMLQDIAEASQARLANIIKALEDQPDVPVNLGQIRDVSHVLSMDLSQGNGNSLFSSGDILGIQQSTNMALTAAIEDMVTSLTSSVENVSTQNRAVIRSLLDKDATYLTTLLELNTWISAFQMAALDVVVAPGVFETHTASGKLAKASSELAKFKDFKDGILFRDLNGLIVLSDPKMGLPAFKTASLQSNAAATRESTATATAVLEISTMARELGHSSLTEIATMATAITADVNQSEQRMQMLMVASGVILLLSLLITRIVILQPLRAISKTTERLAEGDLSEVTGFDRASTEIYRIARALAVFRNGLVEREELAAVTEQERQAYAEAQRTAVEAIGTGLDRLSKGDLSQPITTEISEGYIKLRNDFNSAQNTLRTTLSEVIHSVSSIRHGASSISDASKDLSNRTESQAATLEQTVAALDEMTASVRASASDAREVEETMQLAKSDAQQSGEIVKTAVSAMTEIDRSSAQISQIVNVIDDIAFQTNLLALNAGVEAARAGDSGKGFAVVASEVRALAQRSADSAREIKTLISDSSDHVERGVSLVGKTGDALDSVLDRFNHVSQLISNIAEVAAEQSSGLNEINTGIIQLDRVTQQNASMVEETTEASQMLQSDTSRMAALASQFDIGVLAGDPSLGTDAADVSSDWDLQDLPKAG